MPFFPRIGDALNHEKVTNRPIGDKHLVAVNDVISAFFDRPGLVPGHVRPRIGLGVGARADLLAPAYGGDIGLFLLLDAVLKNGLASE